MNPEIPTLKRQIQQLAHLHASGALSTSLYEDKRAALERQLLDAVLGAADPASAETGAARAPAHPSARPSPRLMALLAVVVFGIAGTGYGWFGSPSRLGFEAPGPAATEGGPENQRNPAADAQVPTTQQIEAMIGVLTSRLKAQPGDAEGWVMLAQAFTVLGRNSEALPAYERAVALRGNDAQLLADYADALAVNNNRVLAGEPMKWIEKALKIDPRNLKALALAGAGAFDQKDYAGAVSYWERVVQFSPPESNYLQQVQTSLAEARQLGGLPAAVASRPASAPESTTRVDGKAVSGTVSLAPALAAQASPEDTVFVFARRPDGKGMPLAILRKKVKDLPLQFTLDDSLAMSPAARISGAGSVVVSARISKSGEALPQAGDLSGQTGAVSLGTDALKLEIRDVVRP